MAVEKQVGIEVEFLVLDSKGEVILAPTYLDRDDFPILGEIRALPGKNMAECMGNFHKKMLDVKSCLAKTHTMSIETMRRVKLKVYQEAMKQCQRAKNEMFGEIKNIYGTNIADFSDQVIKDNKIQGINISCGLHLHFSCRHIDEVEVEDREYEQVELPIAVSTAEGELVKREGVHNLLQPSIYLYKYKGYKTKKTLKAQASLLNKPTIEYIVRHFDEVWFKKFAPKKAECTKYRQPGFWEKKDYGFEYRSLPANAETIEALPDMINDAFALLKIAADN